MLSLLTTFDLLSIRDHIQAVTSIVNVFHARYHPNYKRWLVNPDVNLVSCLPQMSTGSTCIGKYIAVVIDRDQRSVSSSEAGNKPYEW